MSIDYTQEANKASSAYFRLTSLLLSYRVQKREWKRIPTPIEHLLYGGMVLNAFTYISMLKHKQSTDRNPEEEMEAVY